MRCAIGYALYPVRYTAMYAILIRIRCDDFNTYSRLTRCKLNSRLREGARTSVTALRRRGQGPGEFGASLHARTVNVINGKRKGAVVEYG